MSEFETVLQTPDLGPGHSREVQVHGDRVLLVNVGQTYHAVQARCPESGEPLELRTRRAGDRVVCSGDGAEYDLRTGERADGDGARLRRYPVRIQGNDIRVGPALG